MGASKRAWEAMEERSIAALMHRLRILERQMRGVKAALHALGVRECDDCGAPLDPAGECTRNCAEQAAEHDHDQQPTP